MNQNFLPRDPKLPVLADFEALRKEGLEHVEALASDNWSDYNSHDPGVTLLEALCFGLNDLAYRCGFPIEDLLALPDGQAAQNPSEAPLFSPRRILTSNPVTLLDLRKVLLDVDGVKNAWVRPVSENEVPIYADRYRGKLTYQPPPEDPNQRALKLRGLYAVKLALGADRRLGPLDDPSILWQPQGQEFELEIVFPVWNAFRNLSPEALGFLTGEITSLSVERVEIETRANSERCLHLDLGVAQPDLPLTLIESVRVYCRSPNFNVVTHQNDIQTALLTLSDPTHPIWAYRQKVRQALDIVAAAERRLHSVRGLCEDFLQPAPALFEEIALCVELDVEPEADIEQLLGLLTLALEHELSPPIRFHSLKELVRRQAERAARSSKEEDPDANLSTEDIFQGPVLKHGFILDSELRASEPPKAIYASDLMRVILEQVPSVLGVRSFLFSGYGPEGELRAEKAGRKWELPLDDGNLARYSAEKSRFIFYKNGIPFYPNRVEARNKLKLLENGEVGKGELTAADLDFEAPRGVFRAPAEYRSVRDDLPLVYGVGRVGLPASAEPRRHAQAKQLKAYLLLFEQVLANQLTQLASLRQLFSVADDVDSTYFSAPLFELPEISELFFDLDRERLNALAEDSEEFLRRRDRLLNHLLSRFNERFSEHAVIAASLSGVGTRALIASKLDFLRNYPELSQGRNRGINCLSRGGDASGLERRLCALLGLRRSERHPLARSIRIGLLRDKAVPGAAAVGEPGQVALLRDDGQVLLRSVVTDNLDAAHVLAPKFAAQVSDRTLFRITELPNEKFALEADAQAVLGEQHVFDTRAQAEAFLEEIASQQEGFLLIEHILLRPESTAESLLYATLDPTTDPCAEGSCQPDPYSMRATLLVPAWLRRFNQPGFRELVETVARSEAPAHVFLKICWVDWQSFSAVETAYSVWCLEQAQPVPDANALRSAKEALILAMEKLRSVYPYGTLHDCAEDGRDNPIRLGHTQLGAPPDQG